MLVPNCIYPKCNFVKCTRLACLLSFAIYFVFWGTLRPAVLAPRSVWSGYGWDQLPPSSFGHEMYRFPAILWTRFLHLIERHSGEKEKNDRPGDDGTLRSV